MNAYSSSQQPESIDIVSTFDCSNQIEITPNSSINSADNNLHDSYVFDLSCKSSSLSHESVTIIDIESMPLVNVLENNTESNVIAEGTTNDQEIRQKYLFQLLQRSANGKLALAYYNLEQKKLELTENKENNNIEDNSESDCEHCEAENKFNPSILASAIIEFEFLEGRYDIHRDRFLYLSQCIQDLFPTESKDAYYGYRKRDVDNTYSTSQGFLYTQYRKWRKRYISAGLIKINRNVKGSVDQLQLFEFLQQKTNFIDENLKQYWQETLNARTEYLKTHTLHEIQSKLPCLHLEDSYTLLLDDFNQIYPDSSKSFLQNWPNISKYIIDIAKASKKNTFLKEILDANKGPLSSISEQLLALLLLPRLIKSSPQGSSKSKKKKLWKATVEEVTDSFIYFAKDIEGVREYKKKQDQLFASYGQAFNTCAVVVGTLQNPQYSCVLLNNVLYKLDSPIEAFDVCLKCTTALFEYFPSTSKHLWLFLKKYVFDMPCSTVNTYVSKLISKIEIHKNLNTKKRKLYL